VSGATLDAGGPIVLKHVTVQHGVRCRIASSVSAATRIETLTVVRCVSGEPALRDYFLDVAELSVRQLGEEPTKQEVARVIRQLTELFRSFEQSAKNTVQGLWSELVLILLSSNPELLIDRWHADFDEPFDFSDRENRIEVKSFATQTRSHHFSLRQLRPGPGVNVVVASLRAERSSGGLSIADLVSTLHAGLRQESLEKLTTVIAESLGNIAANGLALTFDFERARESLLFFDADSVPAIGSPLPEGVINVWFESLLDEGQSIPLAVLRDRSALYAALAT
jgi:hypothetical protein